MALNDKHPMLLEEVLNLVKLPSDDPTRWYMSTRSAHLPGSDFTPNVGMPGTHKAAFGGHVYAQATWAAARAWREVEDEKGTRPAERLHLHTIHGYFTRPGIPSRPFLYTVTPLTASRSFSTLSVTAHQPSQPSSNPQGDHFPLADANLPLLPACFTAIVSLKRPEPDSLGDDTDTDTGTATSTGGRISSQEPPPQERFADILASRPPGDWPPAPPVDVDAVVAAAGEEQEGRFPVAVMRKVDMRGWNRGRKVQERRELMVYRLRDGPSSRDGNAGGGGETAGAGSGPGTGARQQWDEDERANAHVAAHAYVADRNGLLMAGNHLGLGNSLFRAASLSYSLVVHVNGTEAIFRGGDREQGGGWWIQEASFPRAGAGRGVIESKIWSPEGVHVATEYQDGLVQSFNGEGSGGNGGGESRL